MKAKLGLRALLSAAVAALAACQSYDFEPVEPRALTQARTQASVIGRKNVPNMMLVVDKSGSMNAPANDDDTACPQSCRELREVCPSGCATRWTELQSAMSGFLTESGTVARMGLMTYPANDFCLAPTAPRIELPATDELATLASNASEIRTALNAIRMAGPKDPNEGDDEHTGGGTPTGNTLRALKDYPALSDTTRENFVLLLTDGLPNCNENHPADGAVDAEACVCQADQCREGPSRKLGCLDAAGTIQQINDLQQRGVKTIVVGFGIDAAEPQAAQTLQSMAQAGGFTRECPNGTDAECGVGNRCSPQSLRCENQFFSAKNSEELAAALEEVQKRIDPLCDYRLDVVPHGNNPEFIAVRVDGTTVPSGPDSWTYDTEEGPRVKIQGALCQRLERSTPASPVELDIRVIQAL